MSTTSTTAAAAPPDRAVRGIVASNVLTLVLAVWQDWSLEELLWPFWLQSVVIGWYARQRILALRKFSTEGLRVNGRAVEPTPQTQREVANFFALHYGFFHVGYLVFLLAGVPGEGVRAVGASLAGTGLLGWLGIAAAGIAFWHTHRASHREHVEADLAGTPNLGTLMFLPYARVVPMHLMIILGAVLGGGGVWLFTVLKTLADVVMHKVEHHVLQKSRASVPAR